MAGNNFESNYNTKIAEKVLDSFESARVLSKNVNTQKLTNAFSPKSGTTIDFKRPTDYRSVRTADGDVTLETKSEIVVGNAQGVVQDYVTVFADYDEVDEALKMGDLSDFFPKMGQRIATDLEVDFAIFMMKNCALLSGSPGNQVSTWKEVARAGAVMKGAGIPKDAPWYYTMNPYVQADLADIQRGLGTAPDLVSEAHRNATLSDNFGGMKVMTSETLGSFTTGAGADRAGTLSANPVVTYAGAKDTMTQVLAVTAFQANLVVAAGEVITIAGRNRLNLSTRKPVVDETGSQVLWTGIVTAPVTLSGAGAGNLVVTGPAIFEANGQYNTVDSAPVSGDVVTLGGSAATLYQPNLFWHRDAFSIGSVDIKKLSSVDTLAETADGLQLRVSRGSDFLGNKNKVRFDLHPAYAVLNPFYAGHGYGTA